MEQVQDDPIRMLVGLITTMATTNKDRDELLRALVTLLCSNNEGKNLWHALQGKEGVELLISLLLGVGGPGPHQQYALGLLRLLSNENDESKRAITAALVDLLLNPIPDRPGAPFLALRLLTQLANDCPRNQIVMVESGALGALTNYLSLCPPDDAIEEAATYLLCLLFSTRQIRRSESALGATIQLIAVLLEGGRGARCRAAKALGHLFVDRFIRNDEIAMQAVPPLAEILNTGSDEEEQHTALAALVLLLADFSLFAHGDAEVETISVDVLCRILSSNCCIELKRDAAELCSLIFRKYNIASTAEAARCVEPLVSLLVTELGPCHLPAVITLDQLVAGELLAEEVALGAVVPLVYLLKAKEDYRLQVAVCRLLRNLGKQRPACKAEMLNAGAIEKIDEVYIEEPCGEVDFELSKLRRLLTNNKRGRKRLTNNKRGRKRYVLSELLAKGYSEMMSFDERRIRVPILLQSFSK